MSETAIEVAGLRKRYGDDEAVAGVDLTVARGEVLSLLGPNGAGKTTTVEILEGFRHRDGGTVRVLGEDPGTAGRRWRSRIGVVGQGEALTPRLTVRAVVRRFAGYHPRPRDPDAVVDMVGLGARAGARVTSLSGGQRRRLDVALGVVGRPELLFLDESARLVGELATLFSGGVPELSVRRPTLEEVYLDLVGEAGRERGGAWNPPSVALALGVWCMVGLALVLLTCRWKARKDG